MLKYCLTLNIMLILIVYCTAEDGRCDEPPPVPNTYRIWNGGEDHTWVTYSCYDGYHLLSGNLSRQCIKGVYTGEDPVCVYDCGRPKMVHGATVNFTERVGTVKSTMTFSCLKNYTQVDSIMTVPCNDYVQRWTNEPARCKSSENLAQRASVFTLSSNGEFQTAIGSSCFSTELVKNPVIRLDLTSGDEFYEISEILFKLPQSLEVLPNNITVTLRKTDSTWVIPNCGYPSLGSLVRDEMIQINCSWKAIGQSVAIMGQYTSQEAAVLNVCDVEIYGRLHIVDCGHPGYIPGARVEFKDTLFRSKATYNCEPNFYTLYQGSPATCLFFNVWNYDKIICTDEPNILQEKNALNNQGSLLTMVTDNLDSTCTELGPADTSGWTVEFGLDNYEVRQILLSMEYGGEEVWKNMIVSVKSGVRESVCQLNSQSHSLKNGRFICHSYPIGTSINIHFLQPVSVNLCEIRAFGRKVGSEELLECFRSESGQDYKGLQSYTISGNTCSPWSLHYDSLTKEFGDTSTIESDLLEMNNYCRNPEGVRSKPWCYTDDTQDSWEFCPIISCHTICSVKSDGSDFVGQLDVSKSGKDCQVWSLVDKARPKFPKVTFPNSDDDHNFCRNPGGSQSKPWCYTDSTSLDYEHCHLPTCPISPLGLRAEYTEDDENVNDSFKYCALWLSNDPNRIQQKHNFILTISKMKWYCKNRSNNITAFCSSEDQSGLVWQYVFIHCLYPSTTTNNPTSVSQTRISTSTQNTMINTNPLCGCQITYGNITTMDIIRERIINITTQLTIPRETLSATIRRKISAEDDRPSVSCVGYAALSTLFLVILIIMIPDIIQVVLFIRSAWIKQDDDSFA